MKSLYEYAKDFCGDPTSHERRGAIILDFLKEEGLATHDRVLNLGCGALSEGKPLIEFLNPGCYTGLDPNMWLVKATVDEFPHLLEKRPHFIDRSDFDASENQPYDFVVGHSVLSHVAFWQMQMVLAKTRLVVPEGAKWLASIILDQYTTFDAQWVYPGVSRFRLPDVRTLAYQAGWSVKSMDGSYQRCLTTECPNDTHNWLLLTAIPFPSEMNDERLRLEADHAEANEFAAVERDLHEAFGQARLDAMPRVPLGLQR